MSTSPPKVEHYALHLDAHVFIEWIIILFSYNSSLQIQVEIFQFQTYILYTH